MNSGIFNNPFLIWGRYRKNWLRYELPIYILDMKDEKPITVNASPYGHEFYKKLGFVDTSEEQMTNGVRYVMKRYANSIAMWR